MSRVRTSITDPISKEAIKNQCILLRSYFNSFFQFNIADSIEFISRQIVEHNHAIQMEIELGSIYYKMESYLKALREFSDSWITFNKEKFANANTQFEYFWLHKKELLKGILTFASETRRVQLLKRMAVFNIRAIQEEELLAKQQALNDAD